MTGYLRAVATTLTWRHWAVLQALGLLAIYLTSRETKVFGHLGEHYVGMVLTVSLLAPIAIIADEAVNRGARPRIAYTLAVASTIPVAFVSMALVQGLYLEFLPALAGPADGFWKRAFEVTLEIANFIAFAMVVYLNRRTADRLLENFRGAELRRAQLEQQLVISRLATAEAQIDPAKLLAELGRIKRDLELGRADAEEELADLIQALRVAMARTTVPADGPARPA